MSKSKGRHWWTNGKEEKFQEECPGEGWYFGHLNAGWSGKQGQQRKKKMSQQMQGNQHAVASWNWWKLG